MAKFRITDNQSGKTLVISGDSPPTDQEAEQLFQQSGIRGMTGSQALAKQVPLNQPIPENPPTDNPFAPLAQFLNPNVIKYSQNALQQIGQGNLTPTKPNVTQALAPLGGPLGNLLFGVPNQQAAGMELASDVQGAKAIAGGIGEAINTAGNLGKGIMGAKSIVPSRIVTANRAVDIAKSTAKISSDEVSNAFIKAGENATGGIRDKAMQYAASDAERIAKNPITTTEGLVKEISKQWGASRNPKGILLTKAQAQYANDARDMLMEILKVKDPIVYEQTRKIGKLIKNQEMLGKILKILVPTAVVGGAVRGLGQ